MPYRLAADAVLLLHFSLILFLIGGLLLTLLGWWRGWAWVRNPYFRTGHLLLIAYVIFEAWADIPCPLTLWENNLRLLGGQQPYGQGGCITHWVHRLIFIDAKPWVFVLSYTLFGLFVLLTMIFAPPRFRRRPPRVAG